MLKKVFLVFFISCLSAVYVLAYFEKWYKVSSQIDNETLNDLTFYNDSIIFSVGNLGLIKKGNIKNNRWLRVRGHYHYEDLLSIKVTNKKIYATGLNGTLIISTDEGNSWVDISLNTKEDLLSIDFYENKGIICGTNGTLFQTTDFGISWNKSNFDSKIKLNKVKYVSKDTAILIGEKGFIAITTNNGLVWQNVTILKNSDLLDLTQNEIGSILIGGKGRTLIKTDKFFSDFKLLDCINPPDDFISLLYVNDTLVFAGGFKGGEVQFISTDGGMRWKGSRPEIGPVAHKSFCLDKNKEFAYLCGLLGQVRKIEVKTVNYNDFVNFPNIVEIGPNFNYFTNIFALSQNIIFSISGDVLFKSVDSGFKFEDIYRFDYTLKEVTSFDADNITILMEYFSIVDVSGIKKAYYYSYINNSNDGGRTWSIISLDSGYSSGMTLKAFRNNLLFCYGNSKYFFFSKDKGLSWMKIDTPDSLLLRDLFFVDENKINLVGYNSNDEKYYLCKSYDMGKSWGKIILNELDQFNSKIYFLNDETGFLLLPNRLTNKNNKIFKTTDGGKSWSLKYDEYLTLEDFNEIKFLNDKIGYIVCSSGKLLRTNDCGETWNVSYFKRFELDNGKNRIFFPSSDVSYIFDSRYIYLSKSSSTNVDENFIIDHNFSIFPNPSTYYIEINYNVETGLRHFFTNEINIYNILGDCVLSEKIHPITLSYRMNIEHLPSGIYFVRLGDWVGRFVKIE
ncbi:MAG: YCF48-related protein [Candidatus Kapabacteria bacterium]|nr:YCF48-related protein [Candidatus Kapabacteria bacterium]